MQDSGVDASLHDDIREAIGKIMSAEESEPDDESSHMEDDPALAGDDPCTDSDDDKPLVSLSPSVVVKPHAGEADEPEPVLDEDLIAEIEAVLDEDAAVKKRKKDTWSKYKGSVTCPVCARPVQKDTLRRHQTSAKCGPPGGGAAAGA